MFEKNHCQFVGGFAKIYCLCNSRGDVFYVGCTIKELHERLTGHLGEARQNIYNTPKTKRIKALKYRVVIKELERIWVTGSNSVNAVMKARHKEVYWIREMINRGYNLTNREHQPPIKKRKISSTRLLEALRQKAGNR